MCEELSFLLTDQLLYQGKISSTTNQKKDLEVLPIIHPLDGTLKFRTKRVNLRKQTTIFCSLILLKFNALGVLLLERKPEVLASFLETPLSQKKMWRISSPQWDGQCFCSARTRTLLSSVGLQSALELSWVYLKFSRINKAITWMQLYTTVY